MDRKLERIPKTLLISYLYTKNTVTTDVIRNTGANLALGKQNLLNHIDAINQASLLVYTGINRSGSVYTELEDQWRKPIDGSGVPNLPAMPSETIRAELLSSLRSVKELYKIHLYTPNNQFSYLQVNDFHRSRYNPSFVIPNNKSKPYIEPPHVSHNYGMGEVIPYQKEEMVMTFHRPIIRTPYEDVLAYLSIDFKMDLIQSVSEQLMQDQKSTIYIVNESSQIMYGPEQSNWGTPFQKPFFEQITTPVGDSGYFKWSDKDFSGYVFFEKLETIYMTWFIIKLVPNEQLNANAMGLTRINSLLFGLFLIIAVLLMLYITFRFTRTIKLLLRFVNQVQSGNLQVAIDIDSKDELGLLARRFKSMMHTINELIDREYKLKIANTTNQLKALQAQINPHFMYNALQSIATLALHNKDEKTYTLITSLGKMMRYSMQTEDNIVPLKKELDYLSAYLKLQKQRFGDTFRYSIHAETETGQLQVPKMILQPIVETILNMVMNFEMSKHL